MMIGLLQIWVSTPYFVLLTLDDSWEYLDDYDPYAINISYSDVIAKDTQVNYRLIYANIAENHSAKLVSSFKEICTSI